MSIIRARVSDPRALLGAAGYAITLQVMHPSVAGGVRDHSTYSVDPWGRAFRTADYVMLLCYGSPARVDRLAADLRAAHRTIRGTDHHGHRYSGLEPTAYAWVHATIGEGVVRAHNLMGHTFTPAERDEFWTEWLTLGQRIGVREGDLPGTWAGLQAYMQHMFDEVLEDNDVVQAALENARNPAPGSLPFAWFPRPLFTMMSVPAARFARFLGIGLLPDALRERIGVPWTPAHQAAFTAYCRASKLALMPRRVGPLVLWLRRREEGPFERLLAA